MTDSEPDEQPPGGELTGPTLRPRFSIRAFQPDPAVRSEHEPPGHRIGRQSAAALLAVIAVAVGWWLAGAGSVVLDLLQDYLEWLPLP